MLGTSIVIGIVVLGCWIAFLVYKDRKDDKNFAEKIEDVEQLAVSNQNFLIRFIIADMAKSPKTCDLAMEMADFIMRRKQCSMEEITQLVNLSRGTRTLPPPEPTDEPAPAHPALTASDGEGDLDRLKSRVAEREASPPPSHPATSTETPSSPTPADLVDDGWSEDEAPPPGLETDEHDMVASITGNPPAPTLDNE